MYSLFYDRILITEGTEQYFHSLIDQAERTGTLLGKPRKIDTTLFWYCHTKDCWTALGAYMVGGLK